MVESRVSLTQPQHTMTLCVVASSVLLAGAHLFERVGGLAPCLLCLDQREVHWAALAAGAVAFGLMRLAKAPKRVVGAALGALAVIYVFSAGLAGFHAGVEWGLWEGPQACAAGTQTAMADGADLLAVLNQKAPPPACSQAAWRMFGVSMAGYNALISAGLAILALASCANAAQTLRQRRVQPSFAAE